MNAVLYMKHFIYHFTFIPHGFIIEPTNEGLIVSGVVAQLIRAPHRYRKVTSSSPVEGLSFTGFYIRNCLNCVHYFEDHSLPDFCCFFKIQKSCFSFSLISLNWKWAKFCYLRSFLSQLCGGIFFGWSYPEKVVLLPLKASLANIYWQNTARCKVDAYLHCVWLIQRGYVFLPNGYGYWNPLCKQSWKLIPAKLNVTAPFWAKNTCGSSSFLTIVVIWNN